MINKDAVIADILSADNGDTVIVNNDVRVVVLKNFSIADKFVELEKLILESKNGISQSKQDEAIRVGVSGPIRYHDETTGKTRVFVDGKWEDEPDLLREAAENPYNAQKQRDGDDPFAEGDQILVVDPPENIVVENGDTIEITTFKTKDKKSKKNKMWAPKLKLEACNLCGKNDRPHMGKGRCAWCYFLTEDDIADGKQHKAPPYKAHKSGPRVTTERVVFSEPVKVNRLYGEKDMKDVVEVNKDLVKHPDMGIVKKGLDSLDEDRSPIPASDNTRSLNNVPKDRSFCQYSECKKSRVLYLKEHMFVHEIGKQKFYFCSRSCKDGFVGNNS